MGYYSKDNDKIWYINNGCVKAKLIINASGIQSDLLQHKQTISLSKYDNNNKSSSMLLQPTWEAKPRRGQYCIFKTTTKTIINTSYTTNTNNKNKRYILIFINI